MKKSKLIVFLYVIPVVEILVLFIIKYFNVNSGLNGFKITYTGNVVEIVLALLLLSGIFFLSLKKDIFDKSLKYLLAVSLIYLGTELVALFFILTNINVSDIFILGYPFKKVFIAALLISYKLIYIYLIIFVWLSAFSKRRNIFVTSVIITLLTTVIFILLSYVYNLSYEPPKISGRNGNNLAVVMGAAVWSKNIPSPLFRGRILKAAELYRNGFVNKIQVTGGNAPGEISEARAAYNLLVNHFNVKPEDVLVEENTTTTYEQIKFIKRRLNNIYRNGKIFIVSDKFHLRRVLEMCDFLNVNAIGIASEYKLNWKKLFFYRLRDSIGLLLFWFFAI